MGDISELNTSSTPHLCVQHARRLIYFSLLQYDMGAVGGGAPT